VTTSDCCNLDNHTDDKHTSRTQNAVLSRQNFGDETRKESSEPGSELEDSSQPSLLCRIVNVAVRLCPVLITSLSKS
jgi:hypothetical protein